MVRVALLCMLLSGCGPFNEAVGALAGIEAASLPVFGRGAFDAAYSGVTGRDCSIVRLEQGQRYCVPPEAKLQPPPFCTRSLGQADCWQRPDLLPGAPAGLADAPFPTPEQLADREHRWPRL